VKLTQVIETLNAQQIRVNDPALDFDYCFSINSTYCPAIVRLIQARFPSLLSHLLPFKTPQEISAYFYRKLLLSSGIDAGDIGIFYNTPCAAKIAAVKSPVAEPLNQINGVININSLYNIIQQLLTAKKEDPYQTPGMDPLALNRKALPEKPPVKN
jgi:iron only hydrogenase large subunit-like protein